MRVARTRIPQVAIWSVVGLCAVITVAVLAQLQGAFAAGQPGSPSPWFVGGLLVLHLAVIAGLAFVVLYHVRRSGAAMKRLRQGTEERERVLLALRESEFRLRSLVEYANDSIFILAPKEDRIVDVNPAACRMLGYTREELLSLRISDIHPNEMPQMMEFAKSVLEEGRGRTDKFGCITKTGEYLSAEISASYFTDVDERQCMVCVVRDISERKRTEAEQNRLLSILEETPDIIMTSSPQGALQYINRAGRTLLGLSDDDPIENIRFANCHPAGAFDQLMKEAMPAALQDGVWHGETALLDRNLREVPASMVLIAHKDDAGEVEYLSGILRDISERKKVEEALQLTQFSVDTAATPVLWVEPDGRLAYVNQKACEHLGYTKEELMALKVFDIATEMPEQVWSVHWAELRKKGALVFETRQRRKDGSVVPVEIAANFLSVEGKEYNCTVIFDLTERKRVERALEKRKTYLNALLEFSPVATVVLDAENRVELCNPAFERLFAYTQDELLGKDLDEQLAPPDVRAQAANLTDQVRAGISVNICSQRKRKGGRLVDVEIQGVPLWLDWKFAGTFGLYQDVTERKKAERAIIEKTGELKRSNKELEQFAYVASHDLQEPLRMVASYTQLLARRYQGNLDSDADEFIQYTLDGVHRMQGLINDLLMYSRVGTRAKPLRDTNCQEVFDYSLSNLQVLVGESGAVITHDSLPIVKADATQLGQLFQNLMGNAIKFRGEQPPSIHIGVERNGQNWIFSVSDNGIGIEPEYLERIFVMFQRLHGRNEYPGTGIGLTICKKIIERHQGRIWAESTPGEGTKIFFTLPISPQGREEDMQ